MNTDARRKASAAFVQKRKEAGYRKVTLWLSPEAVFKLDALKASAGSKDKAADAAILAWVGVAPDLAADAALFSSPATLKPVAGPKSSPVRHQKIVEGRKVTITPDSSERRSLADVAVQFGPTERKPGDLSKKSKAPKGK